MSDKTKAELQNEINLLDRKLGDSETNRNYWADMYNKLSKERQLDQLAFTKTRNQLAETEKTNQLAELALKTGEALIHSLESKYANAAGYREAIKDVLQIVPRASGAASKLAQLLATLGEAFKK